MHPWTRCAHSAVHRSYYDSSRDQLVAILEWLLNEETITERRKYDCSPYKGICSNIVVTSLGWLFIIMLHERNGPFFFTKIFLAIKPASLMMFWSLVFTGKNEFDWYFWHSVSLSFLNGSSIFHILWTWSIKVYCTICCNIKIVSLFLSGKNGRPPIPNQCYCGLMKLGLFICYKWFIIYMMGNN